MVDVLVEDPNSRVGAAARLSLPRTRIRVLALGAAIAAVPALLIALQVVASVQGFEGPLESLWRDYAGTPKSMTVPWAGLVLALVGLPARRRIIALGAAVGIDVVCA